MKLHPLTPRKPALPAAAASVLAFIIVVALGMILHFVLVPPVAWLPAGDTPQEADAGFLLQLVVSLFDRALARPGFWACIDGLLGLPQKLTAMLIQFDLAAALAIRVAAIALASLYAGMETHRLILARTIAQPAVRHIKGPRLLTGKAAKALLLSAWYHRYGAGDPGIPLVDGVAMPRRLESEHFLVCGGTGAGKTSILQSIMNGVITRGDRMLALDVKGDVTAKLPTSNAVLLALGDRRSRRWDLGRDVVGREDAEELAIELIPETSDPSWSAGARRVLACLVGHLQDSSRNGPSWSWRELESLLSSPIAELHGLVLERDAATAMFLDTTHDETRKQAMSFYLVLIANALPLVSACARMGQAKGPGFSFRDWVENTGAARVLILRQSQRQPELSATVARLGLKFIADTAAGRTGGDASTPIWLMLDELPQLGRTSAVPRLAAIGRSAGIRLMVTVQSPAQLREIYGAEGAQHLLDNLTTKIVGRVAAGRTATEIAEDWIGKRTVEWWEQSAQHSGGQVKAERKSHEILITEPEFLTSELGLTASIAGLPVVRALVVGHGDVCLLEWPVGLWSDRRPAIVMESVTRKRLATADRESSSLSS
jgi:hypothetical protein